jgi:hypothetical protein
MNGLEAGGRVVVEVEEEEVVEVEDEEVLEVELEVELELLEELELELVVLVVVYAANTKVSLLVKVCTVSEPIVVFVPPVQVPKSAVLYRIITIPEPPDPPANPCPPAPPPPPVFAVPLTPGVEFP